MKTQQLTQQTMLRVDLNEVRELLDRVRAVLAPEDYELLAGLVGTLIELMRLVREKGSTIARLRRLFGLSNTEKTAAVLGDNIDATGATGATEGEASSNVGGQEGDETTEGGAPAKGDKPKRKGHGRIPASDYDARHIDVPHETLCVGKGCPGCARGSLYRLVDPARYLRIFGRAALIAICWDCESLRCGACGQVFTASPPKEALGPKYSESAASMMALLRYGMGLPLNRLGQLQEHLGVPVPASTQWDVALERVVALVPVYDELLRCGADGSVLHNDDTYMRVLEFMGKRRAKLLANGQLPAPDRTGLFTTAIVSITKAGPITIFATGRQHAGENLADLLEKRSQDLGPPIQMCDALDRNLPKGHEVFESNCMAHGRRHIVDEVENFPLECRHVLEQLKIVFANEAHCMNEGWTGEKRLRFHQEQSEPVMDSLKEWMDEQFEKKRIEPNSGLGQAFLYMLTRWDKLTLFLRMRDAPLENNICERVVKMAIRHRRNSLFYRSSRGAHVGDVYMTLIYTAQLHGENPFEYLTALIVHQTRVADGPGDWLPWTYRATLEQLEREATEVA